MLRNNLILKMCSIVLLFLLGACGGRDGGDEGGESGGNGGDGGDGSQSASINVDESISGFEFGSVESTYCFLSESYLSIAVSDDPICMECDTPEVDGNVIYISADLDDQTNNLGSFHTTADGSISNGSYTDEVEADFDVTDPESVGGTWSADFGGGESLTISLENIDCTEDF